MQYIPSIILFLIFTISLDELLFAYKTSDIPFSFIELNETYTKIYTKTFMEFME